MNNSTNIIVQDLMTTYPDQTEFRKGAIVDASKKLGYPMKSVYPLIDGANRVRVGTYNLETFISPLKSQIQTSPEAIPKLAAAMQSIVNDERSYAKVDPTFVPWGAFNDIVKIIKSNY